MAYRCVYYGDEQYLHNDTNGGAVPYNRNGMTSFGSTDAVLLIQYLAALRAANPAVAYGTMNQRWINDDVYIYERELGANTVLVAINKNPSPIRPSRDSSPICLREDTPTIWRKSWVARDHRHWHGRW